MKFLFVTWKNDAGQLAWQVKKEGHDVRLYIDYKSCFDCYDGLLEKVKKPWQNQVNWADIIIFDEIGFAKEAEKLRKMGKKVIGGTPYTDKLEWDREFGQKEMARIGVNILPHWEFSDFDKAIKFISSNPQRYVFKPHGVVSSADHSLLFVGTEKNGKDVSDLLHSNRVKWKYKIKSFMLQEFAGGIEIGVGAFFNGKNFLSPFSFSQEYKRLFPGNLGPLTNDMGGVTIWSKSNEMYRQTMAKFESVLAGTGYIGYFDINCIVNEKGIYPLEFTCRFGYPTIDTQLAGLNIPAGEFLFRLASGENFTIPLNGKFQIAICGATPPFIQSNPQSIAFYHNLAITTTDSKWDLPGIYYKDVKLEDGQLKIAGESKLILMATGSGKSIEIAKEKAYELIKKVQVPNMFYRNDIGEHWENDYILLKKYGFFN